MVQTASVEAGGDRSLHIPVLPWLGFVAAFPIAYLIAGGHYIATAERVSPDDLKAGFVSAELCVAQAGSTGKDEPPPDLLLTMTAEGPLPEGEAGFDLVVEKGREWLDDPASAVVLDAGKTHREFRLSMKSLPVEAGQDVCLSLTSTRDDVKLKGDSTLTVALPFRQPPSRTPPTRPELKLAGPVSLPPDSNAIELTLELLHPEKTPRLVRIDARSARNASLQKTFQEVTLSEESPVQTASFQLKSRPESRGAIEFVAVASGVPALTGSWLVTVEPKAPTPTPTPVPPPVRVVRVEMTTPGLVSREDAALRQQFRAVGLRPGESRTIEVTHNGGDVFDRVSARTTLTADEPTAALTWIVRHRQAITRKGVQFTVRGTNVASLDPGTVIVEPTVPLNPKDGKTLLVVIDVRLYRPRRSPALPENVSPVWFEEALSQEIANRNASLRGGGAIVLQNGRSPRFWDGKDAFGFGGDDAFGPAEAEAAFKAFVDVLNADRSPGNVVVLWANSSAPPGNSALRFPVLPGRRTTLYWMYDFKPEDWGLFSDWWTRDPDGGFDFERENTDNDDPAVDASSLKRFLDKSIPDSK